MSDFYLDEAVDRGYGPLLDAKGHTVLTAAQAGRLGVDDHVQLLTATDLGRVLITHDAGDVLLLYRVWRSFARRWQVDPDDHAGILVVPKTSKALYPQVVREIDGLVRGQRGVWGRYYALDLKWRWSREP